MSDKYQNKYRIPSARLQNWNYGWNALYFVTICTQNKKYYFGNIVDGIMELSNIGKIAQNYWLEIPDHFPFAKLGNFVVMPNHFHGIIIINNPNNDITTVETLHATSLQQKTKSNSTLQKTKSNSTLQTFNKNKQMASISPKYGSLSIIIRSYKSAVTKNAHKIDPDFAWQSRFYDHIIRDEKSYRNISEYIKNNPSKWDDDKLNPDKK